MAANTTLTADIIAKAAVMQLENELVMGKSVFRGYEEEFNKNINGYEVGSTITIRRPMDFEVRDGAKMNVQDVTEGKLTMAVDQRKGIDFAFTSQDLTLNIKDLSKRVIKPAMIQLGNQIDSDLMGLYKDVPGWVGTPGQVIDSNQDFGKGALRLNETSIPMDGRCSVLSPEDEDGLIGAQTTLLNNTLVGSAYTQGSLGKVRGVDTYMSQNVPTHVVGNHGGTPQVRGADQITTYGASKDSNQWTIQTDGWGSNESGVLVPGDVITFAGVFDVNPVTKAKLPHLKQFTVLSTVSSDGSGRADVVLSPAAIATGAHKTVSNAPADNAAITVMGVANTGYRQNMMFRKDAFALVTVPLVAPPGAVDVSRQSYKGINVRVIPVYDGTNDVSKWRLDVLYGVKTIDPRQAVRLSGTA